MSNRRRKKASQSLEISGKVEKTDKPQTKNRRKTRAGNNWLGEKEEMRKRKRRPEVQLIENELKGMEAIE